MEATRKQLERKWDIILKMLLHGARSLSKLQSLKDTGTSMEH